MNDNSLRPFPNLDTQRLMLDALTTNDTQTIFDIFSNPLVIQNYDVQRFTEHEQAAGLIDYFAKRFESDTGIRWGIRLADSGVLIGSCGFNTWNPYDHCAVVGYELAPDHWGKGYAKEAVSRILDFIFADDFYFYVNRVEALILPQNDASSGLVKRLGFQLDGVMRGKTFWNNAFHDISMYSILHNEWRK